MATNQVDIKVKYIPDTSALKGALDKAQKIDFKFNGGDVKKELLTPVQNAMKELNRALSSGADSSSLLKAFDNVGKAADEAKMRASGLMNEITTVFNSPGNQNLLKDLKKYQTELTKAEKASADWDKKYSNKAISKLKMEANVAGLPEARKEIKTFEDQLKISKSLTDEEQQRYEILKKYVNTWNERQAGASKAELEGNVNIAKNKVDTTMSQVMTNEQQLNKVKELSAAQTYINTTAVQAQKGVQGLNTNIKNMSAVADEGKKELIKFGDIVTGTFLGTSLSRLLESGLRRGVEFFKEYDEILTRTMMVTGMTRDEVNGLTDSYSNLANQLTSTIKDVSAAQLVFYQQGLGTQEALKMTEASIAISKTGSIEAGEAADRLTAAVKGYQLAADDAMDIADKMSALDAAAASSVDELTVAMQKSASQARMAGLDLDYYMAYLSTMQEVTREAPENIGTAMKSITSRLQEITDIGKVEEDGTTFSNVAKALTSVGIAAVDSSGQLRALQDIMDDLGPMWATLDKNHKAYLATVLAGNRQQSRFIALMDNYDRAMELVSVSQNASGESAKQLRAYNTGLEASFKELTNAWQTLATKLADSSMISGLVDILTDFVNLINSIPAPVLKLITGLYGLNKVMKSFEKIKSWDKFAELKKFFSGKGIDIKDAEGKIKPFVKNLDKIGNTFDNVKSKATNLFDKLNSGLKNTSDDATEAAHGINLIKDSAAGAGVASEQLNASKAKTVGIIAGEKNETDEYAAVADSAAVSVRKVGKAIDDNAISMNDDDIAMRAQIKDTKDLANASLNADDIARVRSELADTHKRIAEADRYILEAAELQSSDMSQIVKNYKATNPKEYNKWAGAYKRKMIASSKREASFDKAGQTKLENIGDIPKITEVEYVRKHMAGLDVALSESEQSFKAYGASVNKTKEIELSRQKELKKSLDILEKSDKIDKTITDNKLKEEKVQKEKTESDIIETNASNNSANADNKEALASTNAANADNIEAGASTKAGLGEKIVGGIGKAGKGLGKVASAGMTAMMVSSIWQMVPGTEALSDALGMANEDLGTTIGLTAGLGKQFGIVGAAIGATIGLMVSSWKAVDEAAKKAQEAADEAFDEYSRTSEAYTSIKSLASSYDELSKKINKTDEEQEQLNNAIQEMAKLAPGAVVGYDLNGNAILDETKIDEAVEEKRTENAESADKMMQTAMVNANAQAAKDIETAGTKWARVGMTATTAAVGAAVGSIIPGVGTAIGAGIGAIIGGIGGYFGGKEIQKQVLRDKKAIALRKQLVKDSGTMIKGLTEQNALAISQGSEEGLKDRENTAAYILNKSYANFSNELIKAQSENDLSEKEIKEKTKEYEEQISSAFDNLAAVGGLDKISNLTEDITKEIDKGSTWNEVSESFNNQLNAIFEEAGIDDETAKKLTDGIIAKIFSGKYNTKELQDRINEAIDSATKEKKDTSNLETVKSMIPNMNQATVDSIGESGLFDNIEESAPILVKLKDNISAINTSSKNLDGTLNQSAATFQLTAALFGDIDESMDEETVKKYNEAIDNLIASLESPINPSFQEISDLINTNIEDFNTLIDVMDNIADAGNRLDLDNFTKLLGTLDSIEEAMYSDLSVMDMYGGAFKQMADGMSVVDGELVMQANAVSALADIKRLAFLAEVKQMQTEVDLQIQSKEFEQQLLIAQRDALIAGLELEGTAAEKEQLIQTTLKNNLGELNNQWLDNEAIAAANFVALNSTAAKEVADIYSKLAKAKASGDFSQVTGVEKNAQDIYNGLKDKMVKNAKVALDLTNQTDPNKVLRDGIDALNNSIRLNANELEILKAKKVALSSVAQIAEAGNGALAKWSKGAADAADEYIGKLEETFTLLQKIAGLEQKMSKAQEKQSLYQERDGKSYVKNLLTELDLSKEKYQTQKDLFTLEQRMLSDQSSMMKSSEYGNLFGFSEDGTMSLDWESYSKLSGDAAETVDNWVDEYEKLQDQLRETDLALYDHAKTIQELEETYVKIYTEAEDTILDAVKNREEILHEARIKALDDEIDMINKAVDARQKARENQNDAKDLAKSQEALRRATLDSSGKNNASLLQLQEELEEKQLDLSEKRFEQDMEDRTNWLNDTKDAETETYEYRLETMTWYWEEVQAIMESGTENIMNFLITWDEEYKTESTFTQEQIKISWSSTFTALQELFDQGIDFSNLDTGLKNITTELETIDIRIQTVTSDAWKAVAALNSVTSAQNSGGGSRGNGGISSKRGTSTTLDTTGLVKTASKEGAVTGGTISSVNKSAFKVGDKVRTKEGFGGVNQYGWDSSKGKFVDDYANDLVLLGGKYKFKVEDVKLYKDQYYYKVGGTYNDWIKGLQLEKYKNGGMVDYTGPAWVDGTSSNPEAFLSAYQTQQIGALAGALDSNGISNATSNSNVTFGSINFNVASMSSSADGKVALETFVKGANDMMAKKGIGTKLNLNIK